MFGMADSTSADVPMKFWLRAESKPHEQRSPLTPYTCKQLLAAGKIQSVRLCLAHLYMSRFIVLLQVQLPVVVFLCWICLDLLNVFLHTRSFNFLHG